MWTWITLVLVTLVLPVFLLVIDIPSFSTYKKIQRIHGPKGWPIFGISIDIFKLTYSEIFPFLGTIIQTYPKVAKAWILGTPWLILSDPENIEVILNSSTHIKKGFEYSFFSSWLNEGLLTSTGEKWRTRRKLLTAPFHFKILENNVGSLNKQSRILVKNLLEKDEPIDVHSLISLCTLDVICETAMGTSVSAQSNQGEDYIKSIKTVSQGIVFRIMNLYLKDWQFALTPLGFSYNKSVKHLHDYTEKVINQRKIEYKQSKMNKNFDKETSGKQRHAFMDLLIELESTNNSFKTNEDIKEEVDTFMFEGHDTTSSALTFAVFILGLYKDIQEKAYQEQYEIFENSDRHVTNRDLQKMTYLTKVIKETLRLFPSVPYFSRTLTQDVKTKDSLLPKGSNVLIIPYFLHRDETIYPNPEKFDPERFCTDKMAQRHPFAYIPFSAGPRNCIGQKFAMMELKTVLSTIIRFCKIDSVTKWEDLVLIPLVILRNKSPILVKLRPRFD